MNTIQYNNFLNNINYLLNRIAIANTYITLKSHYLTRQDVNKKREEHYYQFLVLPLFKSLLLIEH